MTAAAFLFLLAPLISAGVAQQAPAAADDLADIVVTARKGASRVRPDAGEYFRRYCFGPMRLTGRPATPEDDLDWAPLPAAARASLAVVDPAVPAFGAVDHERGQTLLLKNEDIARKDRLTERRCTLVVIGGEQGGLYGAMSRLLRGGGTQRHVGEREGTAKVAGWRQWLWTAMPARGSPAWRAIRGGAGRGSPDTWLVVSDLRFYDTYDYVFGDLKMRTTGDRPVSMMSLGYVTRERLRR